MRLLSCLLLCCGLCGADEENRLGTLIRWYLNEESPVRREDFLEAIERLTDNDPRKVAAAIRRGEHFDHKARPVLDRGGKHPVFSLRRYRVQPVATCAGDFMTLMVPPNYDPKRAYPLIVELRDTGFPVPKETIVARINVGAHAQARTKAWAAEALVLSLLNHLVDVVHIDPTRVLLRADMRLATLAWYIALHSPDRFAGVLGAQHVWKKGGVLAPNARTLVAMAIEKAKGDPPTKRFMDELKRFSGRHVHLHAPTSAEERRKRLLPEMAKWAKTSVRPHAPSQMHLVSDRGTAMRAFWVRMAPRVPSLKKEPVGRTWTHKVTARPATLQAQVMQDNYVVVKTYRVTAFDLFIDPGMFDANKPLRVQINDDPAPQSKLIHLEIADLLEDYRDRRDTDLLYACRLTFSVR